MARAESRLGPVDKYDCAGMFRCHRRLQAFAQSHGQHPTSLIPPRNTLLYKCCAGLEFTIPAKRGRGRPGGPSASQFPPVRQHQRRQTHRKEAVTMTKPRQKPPRRPRCPRCHTRKHVVPILYGLTGGKERARWGSEYIPGGCVLEEKRPRWHCRRCGHSWRRWLLDLGR